MAWTTQGLIDAYELAETPQLVARSLGAAQEQLLRWKGEGAAGGTVRWQWRYRYPRRGQMTPYVTLPEQCDELITVETLYADSGLTAQTIDDAWLSDNGWSVRRHSYVGFSLLGVFGEVLSIVGRVADDTFRRDAIVASLALQQMGYAEMEQGRGWKRLLDDVRGPQVKGLLPTSRDVLGPAAQMVDDGDRFYIGLMTQAEFDGDWSLVTLTRSDGPAHSLPNWSGKRYLVVGRPMQYPVRRIEIGGVNQLATFTSHPWEIASVPWVYWVSDEPWSGEIASRALVEVS